MPLAQFRSSTASLREELNEWNVASSVEWRQAWRKREARMERVKGRAEGSGGRE